MIKCKECGYECSAQNALGYHLRSHGMSYDDYVVKHDHNGVWPICSCGKRLQRKKGGFSKHCGKSCASKGANNGMFGKKGDDSPNFGLIRSEQQRKNYSKGAKKRWELHGDNLRSMMKTPEYRQSQRDANIISYATTDRAEKTSQSVRKFWQSDSEITKQRRKEASNRAIQLLEIGKIGPQAPFKAEWILNPFTNQQEYMHSSWETLFLNECIKSNFPVTKAHLIRIAYLLPDGSEHIYVPDFVSIDGSNLLIEIKGRRTEVDDIKFKACKAWCVQNGYEVVMIGDAR
jgi:hypothetical protein